MIIRTVLVDDDENSRKAARAALSIYDNINIVAEIDNAEKLYDFLGLNSVDLVFLDIEMEGESGFDIAKFLQEKYPELLFVFLTGHASYAIDGYDFHPINFLTKPINKQKLDTTIQRVKTKMQGSIRVKRDKNAKFMFRCENGYEIVEVGRILYVERRNRKNFIVMSEGELRIINYSMKDLIEILEQYSFFCCHQSYLVPLSKIIAIKDEGHQLYYIQLKGTSQKIPLSRNHYQECHQLLHENGIRVM